MFPNPIPPQTLTPKQQPRPPAALHIPHENTLILPREEDPIPRITMLPGLQPTAYHTPDLKEGGKGRGKQIQDRVLVGAAGPGAVQLVGAASFCCCLFRVLLSSTPQWGWACNLGTGSRLSLHWVCALGDPTRRGLL